jgi:hypothetical protein
MTELDIAIRSMNEDLSKGAGLGNYRSYEFPVDHHSFKLVPESNMLNIPMEWTEMMVWTARHQLIIMSE